MTIKKGDKVSVIAGRDKGKEGIVQVVYPKLNRLVVENVNIRKKHRKPTQKNPEGSIVEIFAPINASNVMLVDPKSKKPTRVGHKMTKDNKKVRVTKLSGSELN